MAQRGGLAWVEWTYGDAPYCVGYSGDGPGTYPRPLELSPGSHPARFVFATAHKPKRVRITAWRETNAQGEPVGPSERLPAELSARRRADGTVAVWRATFDIAPPPDYYLDLYARWPAGRCGGPRHMLRTFHITARPD
jgi:hypothetical protein